MVTYNIENRLTRITVKKGKIEDERTDGIISWSARDMKSGPASFYNIHRKAGAQLFYYTVGWDEQIKDADCFNTMPGLLDCRTVFHTIIPMNKLDYRQAFFNIAETIKTYRKKNLLKTISIYIPEQADMCLAGIYTFLLDIGLDEVVLLYLTESEFEKIDSFLKNYQKKETLWERMDRLMMGTLLSVGSARIPSKLLKVASTFKRKRKEQPQTAV